MVVSFSGMTPLTADDALHLRVLAAETVTIDRTWDARDVRSPYWRFYANDRDGAELLLGGGKRYALTAGQVHFVPAWVRFSCRNVEPLAHLYAHVELVGIPGAVVRDVFPRPLAVALDPPLRAACARLRAQMADHALAPAAKLCHVKSVIYEALGRLFAALPPDRSQRCLELRGISAVVAPALTMIEDRFNETLSNPLLAHACGLSADHFIRCFRTAVGQTPTQYVLERRLAAAAQRLLFSTESIDAIATDCGFGDRYYFTRAFRQRMGLPPAAFRARGHV